jgi:hypothetical protein
MARLKAYEDFLCHFLCHLRAGANDEPRLRAYLAQEPSWLDRYLIALQHVLAGPVQVGFHQSRFFHDDGNGSTVFLTVAIYLETCPEPVAERLRASGLLAESRRKRALYAETFLLGRRTDDAEHILRERREQLIEWALGVLRSLHDHMT